MWAAGDRCCREEEPIGPRHRLTAGPSPEDGEFVSKHNDLQLLEIVRPKAPGRNLPPRNRVTGSGACGSEFLHPSRCVLPARESVSSADCCTWAVPRWRIARSS